MFESLSKFICQEAGPDEATRVSLIRHLAPSIFIARGYDFNELRQLIQHVEDGGSEYVSAAWPEVPVVDPLPCITIRPFDREGYTTSPYELVDRLAGHLRDVLVGAVPVPDFDDIIRFGYIEPESMDRWKEAAKRWRASRGVKGPPEEVAAPVEDKRRALKKAALIAELVKEWPTIEADLKEAARNGLDAARVDGRSGWYYVEDARQWAEPRGKLQKSSKTLTGPSIFSAATMVHRLEG